MFLLRTQFAASISRPRSYLRLCSQCQRKFFPRNRAFSTLPDIPIFKALQSHDPARLAIVHSKSNRSFTYGSLVADVLQSKERLAEKQPAGLSGQRVAFLAENSYDYVGSWLLLFLFILSNGADIDSDVAVYLGK